MQDFPNSADEIRTLAMDLVKFLKSGIKDTHGEQDWTDQNIHLLQTFSANNGAASFPGDGGKQFLWDFISYAKDRGILLAAESEWKTEPHEVNHDFEKLLYVRSPLKLMLCRVRNEDDAEGVSSRLSQFARSTCSEFSPSEVFIIYCVWFADRLGKNQDRVYSLQISGEPCHAPMGSVDFQPVIPD